MKFVIVEIFFLVKSSLKIWERLLYYSTGIQKRTWRRRISRSTIMPGARRFFGRFTWEDRLPPLCAPTFPLDRGFEVPGVPEAGRCDLMATGRRDVDGVLPRLRLGRLRSFFRTIIDAADEVAVASDVRGDGAWSRLSLYSGVDDGLRRVEGVAVIVFRARTRVDFTTTCF